MLPCPPLYLLTNPESTLQLLSQRRTLEKMRAAFCIDPVEPSSMTRTSPPLSEKDTKFRQWDGEGMGRCAEVAKHAHAQEQPPETSTYAMAMTPIEKI